MKTSVSPMVLKISNVPLWLYASFMSAYWVENSIVSFCRKVWKKFLITQSFFEKSPVTDWVNLTCSNKFKFEISWNINITLAENLLFVHQVVQSELAIVQPQVLTWSHVPPFYRTTVKAVATNHGTSLNTWQPRRIFVYGWWARV